MDEKRQAADDEYGFDKAYGTNIIYIYTIGDDAHSGCVKVGKASTPKRNPTPEEVLTAAKKRVEEQMKTAGIKHDKLYAEVAIRTVKDKDGDEVTEAFMDHAVHEVLLRSGISKKDFGTKSQEWFECSVETAKAAIRAVKEGRQTLDATEVKDDYKPINFRPEQRDAINKTIKAFATEDDMLWNAKMRFGKTVTALQVIKEMEFRRTLIFTHRPVVVHGWHEDFQKIFFDKPEFAFGSKMDLGMDLGALEESRKKFVFFASLQDLRGSAAVGGLYNKNTDIYDTDWDCIIIDEAHEGTLTDLGENVFAQLRKKKTKVLRLSGTPFNLLDKFTNATTYTWDYVMEQKAKRNWDTEHPGEPNPYAELPAMTIYTYDISRLLSDKEVEEDSAFNFREFFRTDGDVDDEFVDPDMVKKFLDLLVENDEGSMYPFTNDNFEETFRHTLWMVPGVKAARALSKLLKTHETFKKYTIVNVAGNGDEEEDREEALKKVKSAIGKDPTKTRTITLSCGKLTTGVSVPAWTGVLMLTGSANTAASGYMQTIFRVQTPCCMGGLQKEMCYVFDFAPDRTLQVLADVNHIQSVGKGTKESERAALGDFLNFCPVIAYDGSQMQEYNTDLLFQKMKRVFVERVVRSGFEDEHIYNMQMLKNLDADQVEMFDNLRAIIGSTKAMPKTKGIDLNNSGMTDEEYEEAEKIENETKEHKQKRVLTDEEKELLERLKQQREKAQAAASTLRGIAIRMPLMVYGADIKNEKTELTIDNFARMVDDESWKEFMPEGVTKERFEDFKIFFDQDIFAAASRRIRDLAREADSMNIEERIDHIYTIFSYFRNPDKETVLTPPRVVNMHMGDTLGGWNFFRQTDETGKEYYADEHTTEPTFINVNGVTDKVFGTDSHILEINSKSGLYPLYVTYSIYRKRLEQAAQKLRLKEQQVLWDITVKDNIFVVCKTPMAAAITKRTLCGFRRVKCNALHYPNLLTEIKENQQQLIAKLRQGKKFWRANPYDNMKFNAVVGNPPYQENKSSEKTINNGAFASAIYPSFIDLAIGLNAKYVSLITPSRWMSRVGQGISDAWVDKMLSGNHFICMHDYLDATACFDNVEIKGGVNYFLFSSEYNGKCLYTLHQNGESRTSLTFLDPINSGVVIRDSMAMRIIEKVIKVDGNYFNNKSFVSMVSPKHYFDKGDLLNSNWTGYSKTQDAEHPIKLYVNRRLEPIGYGWIKVTEVPKCQSTIPLHKIFIPESGGSGTDANVLGTPFYGEPNSVCSYTYLVIGYDAEKHNFTKEECENILTYIKSRFFRYMVSIKKKTQHNTREVFQFVPLQDFSRQWTDADLYAKYNLTEDEIEYIERLIKPMA